MQSRERAADGRTGAAGGGLIWVVKLSARYREGRVMRTEALLGITTNDPEAGRGTPARRQDLTATECALYRFLDHSELSRLNRSSKAVPAGSIALLGTGALLVSGDILLYRKNAVS